MGMGAHAEGQTVSVRLTEREHVELCRDHNGMHFCIVKAKTIFAAMRKSAKLHEDSEYLQTVRARRERKLPTHLVVIAREGVPEVTLFTDEEQADLYYVDAGAQWSESYLCEITEGPLV